MSNQLGGEDHLDLLDSFEQGVNLELVDLSVEVVLTRQEEVVEGGDFRVGNEIGFHLFGENCLMVVQYHFVHNQLVFIHQPMPDAVTDLAQSWKNLILESSVSNTSARKLLRSLVYGFGLIWILAQVSKVRKSRILGSL